MRLTIAGERHLVLETTGDGFEVTGGQFGALEMLGASLALCTAAVVFTYGETARLDLRGLRVEVRWEYADAPYRVGRYDMVLHLPAGVPAARHAAIRRAAETCTVHNTLLHPPAIETQIVAGA